MTMVTPSILTASRVSLLVRGRPFRWLCEKASPEQMRWRLQHDNRRWSSQELDHKQVKEKERQEILQEAAYLTRSLYRICLRSVNVIRPGNDVDEREFDRREKEFLSQKPGLLSMTGPPDRDDELESRADYYSSYARESFLQESDCLDENPLRWKDLKRYLYYLRKGDKDRKWLLADMMFPDPYKDSMDQQRIRKFEEMARSHVGEALESKTSHHVDPTATEEVDDPFDDEEDEYPDWFKRKFHKK